MTNDIVSSTKSSSASTCALNDEQFHQALTTIIDSLERLSQEIPSDHVPERGDSYHQRVQLLWDESQALCRRFEADNAGEPERILQQQAAFRERTAPWFSQSWIAQRARSKPSGFAGDFEMLVKLYDQKTPARGIGGYLDLCIQDLPLARAVRARLASARATLLQEIAARSGSIRILDIASGPCREYLDWPECGKETSVEVVAMDNDLEALAYVASHVCPQLPRNTALKPVRYNALRTRSSETTIEAFGKFDIVYSVGLCDYLTDEHLIRLLGAWNEVLNEGGMLYIAFKDTLQYDKTPYQWHLDWFFYQRTLEDVLQLYFAAGFDTSQFVIDRDATGIIITFLSRKQSLNRLRFDAAHAPRRRTVATTPVESKSSSSLH